MAIKTSDKEAWTTREKTHRLRRKGAGTEAFFTRCLLLAGEDAGSFEEVKLEDIPQTDGPGMEAAGV